MSLPPGLRAQCIPIIDNILHEANLTTITRRNIRQGIQDEVDTDLTPYKAAIKALIDERFDIIEAKQNGDSPVVASVEQAEPAPATNGVHKNQVSSPSASPAKRDASEAGSEVIDTPPPKKKRKASLDEDAAFAARLQAEEDKLARPTRGGASRKSAPAKKKKRTKKERVTGSDDSDLEDDAKEQKPKRETGFHKPLILSPALSAFFDGETKMSRPEITKRMWAYIKANDLQDPSDKRYIVCDSKMREIFRQDKVHMFTMTKLISQQMYNPED
ncbi:hypothetical protein HRR83_008438 [Exophiala dermatitidis]|uniref:DM2 domain-containing protein n=1 Tax=Exophiala dermatitidis TaxID=5970 RepID=A0AAN6IR63_EXODE|nr:hypothetical protein HRR75_007708 [Exophiala dermatitidis]KAJ4505923.1 hypothetical protein HRR73_008253 [Exophiala dermatitidis]KAJ4506491.1 hypothetical protein HRR74_008389 [Exophiala dermatitidis]KAJ4533675.1 hypothetical protein HRR77_008429 [Exophiala dermatitidis]KAJ4539352.1 hypothetical protein HRR78_007832 [Exophiala dermatitidis]